MKRDVSPSIKDEKRPVAVGTGLVTLDVVEQMGEPSPAKLLTGGTCANVLLALRFLGFSVAPISRLQDDVAGQFIKEEFSRWGVLTQFVSFTADGSTPVIVQTIRPNAKGQPTHSFSWRCPSCGMRFPSYKPVLVSSAEQIASETQCVQLFFFDRVSRGALVLASRAAELGALVMFEPSGVGDLTLFREAWSVAHIIKYSHERLAELPERLEFGPHQVLQVETLGTDGLLYRHRIARRAVSPWKRLAAFVAPTLKDAAGAGDWCTAGLLFKLAKNGAKGFVDSPPREIEANLRFGQAMAAWNCGFIGARGGMYESTAEECLKAVEHILHGREGNAIRKKVPSEPARDNRAWCPGCQAPDNSNRRTTA